MVLSYEIYIRREVYLALETIRGSNRAWILNFIESLATDPFRKGDATQRDSTGRQCQVKTIGKFAVSYYPDHAEKEVRIVDLFDAEG